MTYEKTVSFRLSADLKELVEEQADKEDATFSEKVREYCRQQAGDEIPAGETVAVSVGDSPTDNQ